MQPLKQARWILIGLLAAIALAIVIFSHFITDYFWFLQLGYGSLFVQPIVWRVAVGGVGGAAAALFLLLNIVAAKGPIARAVAFQQSERSAWTWPRLRWAALFVALVFGLLYGSSLSRMWDVVVLAVNGVSFGVDDPLFHRDIGFYVFSLPFLNVVNAHALGLVGMTALLMGAVYGMGGALRLGGWPPRFSGGARVHLSLLLAALSLLKAWNYALAPFELVYSRRGAVFGATYTDIHAALPAYRALTVIAIALGAALIVNAARPIWRWIAAGLALLLVTSVGFGGLYPAVMQEYVVRPNELDRELPYVQRHIQMTRDAYLLGSIAERDFAPTFEAEPDFWLAHADVLDNIRLWDWRPLLDTYAQLQELRPYYDFIEVDVDRYTIDGEYRQVMLSARELTSASLQNRSWVNLHLQYTHGYGLVMSPVNRVTPQGLPEFVIQNIPPVSAPGLETIRPEIYYGEQDADYVIVNTKRPEFDYGSGDENVTTFYEGSGGVPLGGIMRRLTFSARLGTTKLLFSGDITGESRVMLYRKIADRVRRLAPFLRYDSDPYLVLAEGRLFWMIDAYTTTSRYPYAAPAPGWGNYARNSVKAVIDAYNGSVDFYVFDEEPLIQAWMNVFPDVFKPASDMPDALRAHVRYPEEFFRLQANVLTRYHMVNPQVFYNQEDIWEMPREVTDRAGTPMEPYYTMLKFPDSERAEFVLMLPFTPLNKPNMIAWLAARNDGDRYGEMLLYRFSKQEGTLGPMQFEARIDQDTEISSQLTLWSQQGSRVIRGNLLIIPIGTMLLYVEPLYLQAEQSRMPEFIRVIVGNGRDLVMARSFDEALTQLLGVSAMTSVQRSERPAPSAERGAAATTDDIASLVREASHWFEQAQRRAAEGDWSAYGQALDALAQRLGELEALMESESPE